MFRYAITPGELALESDPRKRAAAAARLVGRCSELAHDEVEFLLVREKELAAGELASLVRAVVTAVRGYGTRVLVARRADVAAAAGASGVHLSAASGDLTPAQVRRILPEAYVSVSCHAIEEVRRAASSGADAILFAPVFGKQVGGKEVAPAAGVEALRLAAEAAGDLPVFALGGVTVGNAAACAAAGARGVAGIRLFFLPAVL